MHHIVSLGYSCQSRFSIDFVSANHLRLPFDFNITTHDALIRALNTDGKSLEHTIDDVSIYTMPLEKRQGVEHNGVFFWHDYPLRSDRITLSDSWRDHIAPVNLKYKSLWPRFSEILRSNTIQKTLIISNSQYNLGEFANSDVDFEEKFGLGQNFYNRLCQTLNEYGAKNYSVTFHSRNISQVEAVSAAVRNPQFECHFVGVLSLPANHKIAVATLGAPVGRANIEDVCGVFDGNKTVRKINSHSALIYRATADGEKLWGSFISAQNGYVATFEGRDACHTAVLDGRDVYFSNKTRWLRS